MGDYPPIISELDVPRRTRVGRSETRGRVSCEWSGDFGSLCRRERWGWRFREEDQ